MHFASTQAARLPLARLGHHQRQSYHSGVLASLKRVDQIICSGLRNQTIKQCLFVDTTTMVDLGAESHSGYDEQHTDSR